MALALALTVAAGSIGGVAAGADPDPVYYLPAPAGTGLVVSQGNGVANQRTAAERHAFDFVASAAPERFPVLAARGGTVLGSRTNVPGGRCREIGDERPACWRAVNYVLIDHGDGSSGLYLHLRRGQPAVRRGDVVGVGQPIGRAGASGWTDEVGVRFQLQETPAWDARGKGGWFQTTSLPVAFSDPDAVSQRTNGVPITGDVVVSGNPGAAYPPFRFRRRPAELPASVPLGMGSGREIASAYAADSPDGYGLHIAGALPGDATMVRPLFGGELVFAGCATGASASLGRTVVVARELDGMTYHAVLGHFSQIEPSLLEHDLAAGPLVIAPNELLGYYGAIEDSSDLTCAAETAEVAAGDSASTVEPPVDDLFAAILRDADVSPEGEIVGGTPVSPEPLVGVKGYEGLRWWSGPIEATEMAEGRGRPRARWDRRQTVTGRIPFGDTARLVARVQDPVDIAEVRFRAWYPDWPRTAPSSRLTSFDPDTAWRTLATCQPPSAGGRTPCTWRGDARDAVVIYRWDPTLAQTTDVVPWLPRARTAMTRAHRECVPATVAVEVVDRAGRVWSEMGSLPVPVTCDEAAVREDGAARVLYLDPLVPPAAPRRLSAGARRLFAPRPAEDSEPGVVRWRDVADNEDGYRVYARRSHFTEACDIARGPWVRVGDLAADAGRYQPRHARMLRLTPVDLPEAPGKLTSYELYVSSFNEAGESERVRMGTFQKERGFFCDTGLPGPDLPLARSLP